MGKIYYYYDPVVQTNDYRDRFAVNYYETNGKQKIWAGRLVESTPTAVLFGLCVALVQKDSPTHHSLCPLLSIYV